jgi:hypothetical protein
MTRCFCTWLCSCLTACSGVNKSHLTGDVLSHRTALVGAISECLSRGCEAPGTGFLSWCCLPESLMDKYIHGEARFSQGMLIRCQSYQSDYACSCGGAAMSNGDGMDPSTQVLVVRCAWVPLALSYYISRLMPLSPEDPVTTAFLGTESPRAWLPGVRVRSELGCMEDISSTDRW